MLRPRVGALTGALPPPRAFRRRRTAGSAGRARLTATRTTTVRKRHHSVTFGTVTPASRHLPGSSLFPSPDLLALSASLHAGHSHAAAPAAAAAVDHGHSHANLAPGEECNDPSHDHGHSHAHLKPGESCDHPSHITETVHDDEVRSVSLTLPGDLDLDKLNDFLGGLLEDNWQDLYRMKGVLSVEGFPERYVVQGVHALFEGSVDRMWKARLRRGRTPPHPLA